MELKLISAAAGEDETTLAGRCTTKASTVLTIPLPLPRRLHVLLVLRSGLAGGLCFDFRGGKERIESCMWSSHVHLVLCLSKDTATFVAFNSDDCKD